MDGRAGGAGVGERREHRARSFAFVAVALALLVALALVEPSAPALSSADVAPRAERVVGTPAAEGVTSDPAGAPEAARGAASVAAEETAAPAARPGPRAFVTLDGAPWGGVVVRLVEVDAAARPTGRDLTCTSAADGSFALDGVERGWWSITPGADWPAGCTLDAEIVLDDGTSRGGGECRPGVVVCVGPADRVGLEHALDHDRVVCEAPAIDAAWQLGLHVFTPIPVRGRVVDAAGTPVAGATIRRAGCSLSDPPLGSTDPAGGFTVAVPWTSSDLSLVAAADGHAPGATSLDAEHLVEPVTIALGHALVPISGVVRDADGAVVPEARVSASVDLPGGAASVQWWVGTTSDAAGRFELLLPGGAGAPPVGPWCARVRLYARHPAFAILAEWAGCVGAGSPPCELVVLRGARLEGRVLGADGLPLARTVVNAGSGDPVVTRADGRFVLEEVPERFVLRVRRRDLEDHLEARLLVVLPLALPLEVRLERGETVQGVVRDAAGRPCRVRVQGDVDLPSPALVWPARGTVVAQELTRVHVSVSSDDDGRFALGPVPRGAKVRLWVDSRVPLAEATAGDRDVDLRRASAPSWVERSVRLRAVEAESRRPLRVSLVTGRGKTTLEPGEEQPHVLAVRADRPTVRVEAPGRVGVEREGPPGEGVLELGVVALERAGELALTVRWPRVPVFELRATWRDPDGRAREAWREPDALPGRPWTLDCVVPGSVTVEVVVTASGLRDVVWLTFDAVVRAGEVTPVELDLAAAIEALSPAR